MTRLAEIKNKAEGVSQLMRSQIKLDLVVPFLMHEEHFSFGILVGVVIKMMI